ncbi:MAG: hypothetical protein CM1200mP18_00710 [Gammaproteobacteria bacterium]|nr:MAG: hypothetical protein CM1200mP18_00710 [Gammaproteobacteria bacterium]
MAKRSRATLFGQKPIWTEKQAVSHTILKGQRIIDEGIRMKVTREK